MEQSSFYELAHLTDLHIDFDESRIDQGVWGLWPRSHRVLRELDWLSISSGRALNAAALLVEKRLREASCPAHCVVSGDICTWPYDGPTVEEAYGYFSGGLVHEGRRVGFKRGVRSRFIFTLGNHDTLYWRWDQHYRESSFHQVHGAASPVRIRLVRTDHRWVIFFALRTDFLPSWGWLRSPLLHPACLSLLQKFNEDAMAGTNRRLSKLGCDAPTYKRAVKILVLHHSPLPRRDYRNMSRHKYWLLYLIPRGAIQRFARAVGIHMVLFGHTHQAIDPVEQKGTLYLDGGTASALTLQELETGIQKVYMVSYFKLLRDDTLLIQRFSMDEDFTSRVIESRYRLLDTGVEPIALVSP